MYSQIRNILIACIILVALGGIFQTATADPEANKALMRRVLEEAYNQGNLDVIDEAMAADYTWPMDNPQVRSSEEFKQHVAEVRTNFPDIHAIVEDQIAEGDKVVTRWTIVLTPQVTMTGILISIIADGKIAGDWENYDELGLMQQLGAIPPTRETYTWGDPSSVTGDPGDPETNKAIVQRSADEIWNTGNLAIVDEIYGAEFLNHDPTAPDVRDLESYKQFIVGALAAFPDFHVTAEDVVAEGDKVAVRWTATGTQEGELPGIPATGRQVTWTGIDIHRIADGKIVEIWWSKDMLGMIQQLTAPEWPIAGAWISIVPIPGLGDIIGEWTVSPQDPNGTNFTSVMRPGKPEATVFGSFPDADHQSDHIGQTMKTGLNTYESTMVGYGTKKAELPGMLPEIVYISVIYGKVQLIDENTMQGQGTHAFFAPSADADGDGLPDEGQEPIACFPYTITAKRVQLMPPCVPPPPEPEGE